MLTILKTNFLKLAYSFAASPLFATLAMFVNPLEEMLTREEDFFTTLLMALSIDLVIGIIKYVKLFQFSFREMLLGFIVKVFVAFGGMVLFLSFAGLEEGWASEWFTLVAKFTVLLYPAGSALTNMYVITNGKFPPLEFMKRLKWFDGMVTPSTLTIGEEQSANKETTEDGGHESKS